MSYNSADGQRIGRCLQKKSRVIQSLLKYFSALRPREGKGSVTASCEAELCMGDVLLKNKRRLLQCLYAYVSCLFSALEFLPSCIEIPPFHMDLEFPDWCVFPLHSCSQSISCPNRSWYLTEGRGEGSLCDIFHHVLAVCTRRREINVFM